MTHRALTLLMALGMAAPLAAQSPSPSTDPAELLSLGRKLTTWFLAGQADSIHAHLSAESQQQVGGVAGIQRTIADFQSRAGEEVGVLVEQMNRRRGLPQFWHEGTFTNFPEPLVIRWVFDSTARVVGVGLGPKGSTPAPDEGS